MQQTGQAIDGFSGFDGPSRVTRLVIAGTVAACRMVFPSSSKGQVGPFKANLEVLLHEIIVKAQEPV